MNNIFITTASFNTYKVFVTKKYIAEGATLTSSGKDLPYNQTLNQWKTCSKAVIVHLRSVDLLYAKNLHCKNEFYNSAGSR